MVAQDTVNFAGEIAAAEGGAALGAKFGTEVAPFFGPYAEFVPPVAALVGGVAGVAAYSHTTIENDVQAGVARFVDGSVKGIDETVNNFTASYHQVINYLSWEFSYPEGPYP